MESDEAYIEVYRELSSIKKQETSPDILRHDSSNLVTIQRLRGKYPGTPLGSAVWLATIDNSLPTLERFLEGGTQFHIADLLSSGEKCWSIFRMSESS
jgi:hypothetical protein